MDQLDHQIQQEEGRPRPSSHERGSHKQPRNFFKIIKLWTLVILLGWVVYVALHNRDGIHVSIPPFLELPQIPAYLLYFSHFAAGVLLTTLWMGWDNFKKSREIKRLENKVNQAHTP